MIGRAMVAGEDARVLINYDLGTMIRFDELEKRYLGTPVRKGLQIELRSSVYVGQDTPVGVWLAGGSKNGTIALSIRRQAGPETYQEWKLGGQESSESRLTNYVLKKGPHEFVWQLEGNFDRALFQILYQGQGVALIPHSDWRRKVTREDSRLPINVSSANDLPVPSEALELSK